MEKEEVIKRLAELKADILNIDREIEMMLEEIDSEEENEKDKKEIRKIVRDFCLENADEFLDGNIEMGRDKSVRLYKRIYKKFKYIKREKMTVYKALKYAEIEFEYLKEKDKDDWNIIRILSIPKE